MFVMPDVETLKNLMKLIFHTKWIYLYNNYQVPFWGLSDLTFQWRDWQKCMIPLLKAGFMELLIGYFLAHSATLSYLYNNYQVLFWGFGRCSPTAFSRLWQMGPHMKALSPRSDIHPFWHTQPPSPIYIIIIKCFFGVLGGFLPQLSANCNKWGLRPHLSHSAGSCGRKPPKTPKKHLIFII